MSALATLQEAAFTQIDFLKETCQQTLSLSSERATEINHRIQQLRLQLLGSEASTRDSIVESQLLRLIHTVERLRGFHSLAVQSKVYGGLGEPFFISFTGALPVPQPALTLYPLPSVGRYTPQDYPTAAIHLLLKKEARNCRLQATMPPLLQQELSQHKASQMEFYFIITDLQPILQSCQQTLPLECNLLYHAWLFPTIVVGQSFTKELMMGMFSEEGSQITAAAAIFNRMGHQVVNPHPYGNFPGLMMCSPNNAHLHVAEGVNLAHFWSFAHSEGRAIVTWQWLLCQKESADIFYRGLLEVQNVEQAYSFLQQIQLVPTALLKRLKKVLHA